MNLFKFKSKVKIKDKVKEKEYTISEKGLKALGESLTTLNGCLDNTIMGEYYNHIDITTVTESDIQYLLGIASTLHDDQRVRDITSRYKALALVFGWDVAGNITSKEVD